MTERLSRHPNRENRSVYFTPPVGPFISAQFRESIVIFYAQVKIKQF